MSKVYKWLNYEKSRYYTISIKKSESNEIVLSHTWGGLNNNRGGRKNIFVNTYEEMQKYIYQMIKRRKSRGYELVTTLMN